MKHYMSAVCSEIQANTGVFFPCVNVIMEYVFVFLMTAKEKGSHTEFDSSLWTIKSDAGG